MVQDPAKKDKPIVALDETAGSIIDPAPDKPLGWKDSPVGKAVWKGAKWGMVAGFFVAQIFIWSGSIDTPFGSIYTGNLFLMFAFWIGLGAALGAGVAWLNTRKIGEDDDDSPRPIDPIE
jgi:hypothetical protein